MPPIDRDTKYKARKGRRPVEDGTDPQAGARRFTPQWKVPRAKLHPDKRYLRDPPRRGTYNRKERQD